MLKVRVAVGCVAPRRLYSTCRVPSCLGVGKNVPSREGYCLVQNKQMGCQLDLLLHLDFSELKRITAEGRAELHGDCRGTEDGNGFRNGTVFFFVLKLKMSVECKLGGQM